MQHAGLAIRWQGHYGHTHGLRTCAACAGLALQPHLGQEGKVRVLVHGGVSQRVKDIKAVGARVCVIGAQVKVVDKLSGEVRAIAKRRQVPGQPRAVQSETLKLGPATCSVRVVKIC